MDRWDNPHFENWLEALPDGAAIEVQAGIEYLLEHGRGAQLDLVRHRIQTSSHYPDMSEVRIRYPGPPELVVRVLTCFVREDKMLLVLIAGDKAAWGRTSRDDWYDRHVPIADLIVTRYLETNPPKR